MKRKFKRIASLVLAMVMVFAMAMPAMATGIERGKSTYTISVSPTEQETKEGATHGHSYKAYQIFKGTLSTAEGGKTEILSNIDWGADITDPIGKNAVLGAFAALADGDPLHHAAFADIKELLDFLGEKSSSPDAAKAIARALATTDGALKSDGGTGLEWNENAYKTTKEVDSGYYLILDSAAGNKDAISDYIVEVVTDTNIKPKVSVPSVDKQVQDNEDAEATTGDDGTKNEGWGETADYKINDKINFKLTGEIPANENYVAYEKYKLVFEDVMSKGLTFDAITSVKIKIEGESSDLDVTTEVGSPNTTGLVGNKGDGTTAWTLTIEDLIALLTGKDKGSAWGTKNITVVVEYTAHLNEEAEVGHTPNSNKVVLKYSNETSGEGLGETPEDTVFVFTYDIPAEKVTPDGEGKNQPLAGAGFRLYSNRACEAGDEIKLKKVEAGDSWYYCPVNEGEEGEELVAPKEGENIGKFDIRGLDIGTYYLKETTTPPGYNTCEPNPIEIKIVPKDALDQVDNTDDNSGHRETADGSSATTHFSRTNGEITTVVNNHGTTLPETGGIGTTIFYVVGSVLVLGAVILLVTKRRMKG